MNKRKVIANAVFITLVFTLCFFSIDFVQGKEMESMQEQGKTEQSPMMVQMKLIEACQDTVNGGYFHACSEDLTQITDRTKYALDQFMLARMLSMSSLGGARPMAKAAGKLLDLTIEKFEDKKNGGFYYSAKEDWSILDKTKYTALLAESDGPILHYYEVCLDDKYLLKMFELLDLLYEKCWDKTNGGFFDSFQEDWTPKSKLKSLKTQMAVLQALVGGWKDGIDSPYATKAEWCKQKARELVILVFQKMWDPKNGGFYTSCNEDWSVNDATKDLRAHAAAISSLSFHYNNIGPCLWGPRKGSHAYTGRPVPSHYSFRGPAPNPFPINDEAYQLAKKIIEISFLVMDKFWDKDHGGFFNSCTQSWEPKDRNKSTLGNDSVVTALNVIYRLTGFSEFREKISQAVSAMTEKAKDHKNEGYYDTYTPDWKPLKREKSLTVNQEAPILMTMFQATMKTPPIPKTMFRVWIAPSHLTIKDGGVGEYTVTVQNQGFSKERVRIGGLTALSRWMNPGESSLDLEPHQLFSYTLKVQPPKGLKGKTYPFEITVIPESNAGQYFSEIATITLE
jgi:mannose/cellobiose epimerase-like protein (N-acyl-D-glucosamine 2-epimerase family)